MNAALAPTLTAADRCDRCSAQAYVRARSTLVESSCSAHTTVASTSRRSSATPTSTTRATGSWSPWTAAAPSDVDPVSDALGTLGPATAHSSSA